MHKFIVSGLLLLTLSSCSKSVQKAFDSKGIADLGITEEVMKDRILLKSESLKPEIPVSLQYLGCGGFYFGYRGEGFLIDPFFSNQKFLTLPFKKIKPKTDDIKEGISDIPEDVAINAIFISHSHYDHLFDTPYLSANEYTSAKIYGSRSTKTILKPVVNNTLIHDISCGVVTYDQQSVSEKQWIKVSDNLRVLPIKSNHAPHVRFLFPIKMYKGVAKKPIKDYNSPVAASMATKWKEGETYSFLVDVLEEGNTIYRIFLQSSASAYPGGFVPDVLLKEKPVDLTILGGASFHNIKKQEYPRKIINHLGAEEILICHWEDFFKGYQKAPKRFVRLTNFKKLMKRLDSYGTKFQFTNVKCQISIEHGT